MAPRLVVADFDCDDAAVDAFLGCFDPADCDSRDCEVEKCESRDDHRDAMRCAVSAAPLKGNSDWSEKFKDLSQKAREAGRDVQILVALGIIERLLGKMLKKQEAIYDAVAPWVADPGPADPGPSPAYEPAPSSPPPPVGVWWYPPLLMPILLPPVPTPDDISRALNTFIQALLPTIPVPAAPPAQVPPTVNPAP